MQQSPVEPNDPPRPEAPAADPPIRLSRWSHVVLLGAGLLIGLVTAVQLAAVMLVSGPSNTISQRYQPQLTGWTQPWLEQDWQLFGPNPQSTNTRILVRTRTGSGAVGPWVDLTAIDYAAITHDPMPSQANQNELRRAWSQYASLAPSSPLAATVRNYLVNIALQRLGSPGYGAGAASVSAIEFRVETVPIPEPGSTGPVGPSVQDLSWWTVVNQSKGAEAE
jgi:hypothetical protein